MNAQIVLTIGVRVLRIGLGLMSSLITARALGPAGRGEFFYVVTLAALVVQFGNLGLHASNTFYVARDERLLPRLMSNSAWSAIVVGLLGGALVALGARAVGALANELVLFVPVLAAASLLYLLGTNLLVGTRRIALYNAFELGANGFVVLALSLAAVLGAGVAGFVAMSTAGWLVASAVLVAVLARVARARWRFSRDVFLSSVRYGGRAYIVSLLGFLVLRSNVFLLERLSGSAQLGQYSVAAQVGDVLAILPSSVALVLFPSLVREREGSWGRTLRTAAAVAGVSAAACIVTGLFARPLIRILFGADFDASADALLVLLPGAIALAIVTVLSQFLAALAFPTELIAAWGAAVILVLAAGAVLIPMLGGVGAAAALSLCYVSLLVLVSLIGYAHRNDTGSALLSFPVPE